MHPTNFTQSNKNIVIKLHVMEVTISNLLMLQKYISSKQKTQK